MNAIVPVTSDILANTHTTNKQFDLAVTALEGVKFVVVRASSLQEGGTDPRTGS